MNMNFVPSSTHSTRHMGDLACGNPIVQLSIALLLDPKPKKSRIVETIRGTASGIVVFTAFISVHHCRNLRYKLGKDVFIAPYDWRLAGDAHSKRQNGVGGYYPELQLLIEEAVKAAWLT